MVNGVSLYKNLLEVFDKKVEDQRKVDVEKKQKEESPSHTESTDTITLSSDAQVLSKVKESASEDSGIREDRVEELKNKIQSGEYQINTKNIAAKLIDELV